MLRFAFLSLIFGMFFAGCSLKADLSGGYVGYGYSGCGCGYTGCCGSSYCGSYYSPVIGCCNGF